MNEESDWYQKLINQKFQKSRQTQKFKIKGKNKSLISFKL